MKTKKTYKVQGMHCASCAMLIEGELEDRGLSASCSFAKGIVEVEGEHETMTDKTVKEAVEAAGYTVIPE